MRIHSDSSYTIQIATLWGAKWERNEYRLSDGKDCSNVDLVMELRKKQREAEREGITVTWQWTRGHAGDKGNEGAHNLAICGARTPV